MSASRIDADMLRLVRAAAAVCGEWRDAIEPAALRKIAADLAEITEYSAAQLQLAACAPVGSLGRRWFTELFQGHLDRAGLALGHTVLWSEAREWHRRLQDGAL